MSRPLCMDDAELAAWAAANRQLQKRNDTPCRDCLAGYAAEMRMAGRCNGSPGMAPPTGRPVRTAEERVAARRTYWRERARMRRAAVAA